MPEQYIGLLTGLLSTAMGGALALASGYLQLARQDRRRTAEVHRDRGEELYMLTEQWLNMLLCNAISLMSVMQGKLTYNQNLELTISEGEKNPVNFSRIGLLVDVYFPGTRNAYDDSPQGSRDA